MHEVMLIFIREGEERRRGSHISFITHLIRGPENRKIQTFNGYRVKQKVTYKSTPN